MNNNTDEIQEELSKIKKDIKTNSELTKYSKNIPDLGKKNLQCVRNLNGHFSKVFSMCWSGDSKYIVSVALFSDPFLWNAEKGKFLMKIPVRRNYELTCCFSPSDQLLATGGLNNMITILKIDLSEIESHIEIEYFSHDGYVSCLKFVGEQFLLSSSGDTTCKLWDIEAGLEDKKASIIFSGHTHDVSGIDVHYNQNVFISGSYDPSIKLWDIRTGKCELTFSGLQDNVNCVKFHPTYQAFGACSDDSTCKLFDLRTASELAEYSSENTQDCYINSIDFSCSGKLLFAGCHDGLIRVWDVLKQKIHSVLNKHTSKISGVCVSNDGSALCSVGSDKQIYVWA